MAKPKKARDDRRVGVSFKPEAYERIRKAAERLGLSDAAFCRVGALEKANALIGDQTDDA